MEKKPVKSWNQNNVTIRVINQVCGRVDVHRNIDPDDITWMTANPNLEVEIIEYNLKGKKHSKDD